MSNIYNFASQISQGNVADERIRAVNRQIDAQNALARDNFNSLRQTEKENKAVAEQNVNEKEVEDRADEGQEGSKVLSSVNDLVASRNKGKEAVPDEAETSPSDVDTSTAPQSEGGNQEPLEETTNETGELNTSPSEPVEISPEQLDSIAESGTLKDTRFPETSRLLGDGEFELRPEKVDFDSDRLFTTEGAMGLDTGRILPSGESGTRYVVRAYPVNEGNPVRDSPLLNPIEENVRPPASTSEDLVSNLARSAGATEEVAETAGKAGNLVSRGLKAIGTEGGVLGTGLSGALKGATILTGGYDAVKDIADPKSFGKLDTGDKVSNIAGIVSGGLETAGLAATATGLGAPVGAVLEGLGLLSGAVGLGAGLIGDITGEKKQQTAVSKMPTIAPQAKAPQQQKVSFQSAFQGGQLVQ